jgi:very-short-patch-repair endonuclease
MANEFARKLRKRLTPQEVKVWNHLRTWRDQGFHFRRQAPRQGYIVDFVCLKYKIVVEIDGGQHNFESHRKPDEEHDERLKTNGFRVLRFWNSDVDLNLSGVLETIHTALGERTPHPTAFGGHPPPLGEG